MILSAREDFVLGMVLMVFVAVVFALIGYTWCRSNTSMERFDYCQKVLSQNSWVQKTTVEYCLR